MTWVRFPIWDHWKELTRFRVASEMALSSYSAYLEALPIISSAPISVKEPSGSSKFECSLPDFLAVIKDKEYLYKILLPSYTALLEEHARNLIEELINQKKISGSNLTGNASQDAETYVRNVNVETWGQAILNAGGRSWTDFDGGAVILVEAFVVRNLISHGLRNFNLSAINRINNVGTPRVAVGQSIELSSATFQEYVATMRAFARATAGAVADPV